MNKRRQCDESHRGDTRVREGHDLDITGMLTMLKGYLIGLVVYSVQMTQCLE